MRSSSVRDRALKLSFHALVIPPKQNSNGNAANVHVHTDAEGGVAEADGASVDALQVKRVLKLMRPHYNSLKVSGCLSLCVCFFNESFCD